jgi:CRISPR-associated protein Csm4
MRLYKSALILSSASATLWQADTIFGHLCWKLLRRSGEGALKQFLELYEHGEPPILLSDGFPGDYLPRPLAPPCAEDPSRLAKLERVERQREAKEATRSEWLSLDDFNLARQGKPVKSPPKKDAVAEVMCFGVTAKNQINRLTNTTGAGGELYDMGEFILTRVTVYWRIADDHFDDVKNFLTDLQATGYGKRKSVGYGHVESFTLEEFDGFAEVPEADGFVTLSRFVPAPSDPTDGFWRAVVKYGKLGEEFAVGGNPFKRPLIQLAAGSCFRSVPMREWYGRIVEGLSARPEVKQYGLAFPVPMRLPKTSVDM